MARLISNGKIMMGAMYAPFCRTKYVDMSSWENDIRNMAEMGYTCIHAFTEWWRIEKKKGEFDFSQTDYLAQLCQKYGISLVFNVATQNGVGYYMPRWMQEEYRGRGMVDSDGYGNPIRSEYVVACMDDPWYQMYAQRYLCALATHYAGDSRVAGWVIWGEPMLTSDTGKPICYCEHTLARFRCWLKEKYGAIENLNPAWGNEGPAMWTDFAGVLPPRDALGHKGSYASWSDFARFMDENFATHIKNADRIFKQCGATQPTIVELFCYIGWDAICNDLWLLAETADIVGISNYCRPGLDTDIVMTVADSIANPLGKTTFVVEALGGPRYPYYDKRTPGCAEIRAEGIQAVGGGSRGVLYWCYRPRLSDYEGGTFGICRADGVPLPRAYAIGDLTRQLGQDWEEILHAQRKAEVAVLYSTHAAHTSKGDRLGSMLGKSVQGALRLLFDARITPRLIHEESILAGELSQYKALILPFAYAMDEDVIEEIARFVQEGGILLADHCLAMKRLNGICYETLPGGKFREIFGTQRVDLLYLEHSSQIPSNDWGVQTEDCLDILVSEGGMVEEMLGQYPLWIVNQYGKGCAHALAWPAFAGYCAQPRRILRDKIKGILAGAGIESMIELEAWDDGDECPISTQVLHGQNGKRIYTIVNPGYEPRQLIARIPGAQKIYPLLNAKFSTLYTQEGAQISLELSAWDAVMLIAEASEA